MPAKTRRQPRYDALLFAASVLLAIPGLSAADTVTATASLIGPAAVVGGSVAPTGTSLAGRRWSISFDVVGGTAAGAAGGLEDAMRAAHFDDTLQFFGTTTHPRSSMSCGVLVTHSCEDSLPSIEVARRLNGPWSFSAIFSRSPPGMTIGYHAAAAQFLDLEHRVDSIGALVSIGNSAAQIGVGPALHVTRIRESAGPSGVEQAWANGTKLGFTMRARATIPARSRFFLDLRAEFHFTGSTTVGPYSPARGLLTGTSTVLPPTAVSFNQFFFGVGPGLRF